MYSILEICPRPAREVNKCTITYETPRAYYPNIYIVATKKVAKLFPCCRLKSFIIVTIHERRYLYAGRLDPPPRLLHILFPCHIKLFNVLVMMSWKHTYVHTTTWFEFLEAWHCSWHLQIRIEMSTALLKGQLISDAIFKVFIWTKN